MPMMKGNESPSTDHKRNKPESLAELYRRGVAIHELSPGEAIPILEDVQTQISLLSLLSSNEEFSELPTNSLPFLTLEHHLAMCYVNLPSGPNQMGERFSNLQRACDLWIIFLQRLEQLELMKKDELLLFEDLATMQTSLASTEAGQTPLISPPVQRETKIARFRAKQAAKAEIKQLEALKERRVRLDAPDSDELDGYDHDSLLREIHRKTVEICKVDALDEWASVIRELPMVILMMAQRHQEDSETAARHGGPEADRRAPPHQKPLQVTHITQDILGQLQIRKELIRSQVFQPHWNQPTMSLEELAEKEMAEAMKREERRSSAERERKGTARRYDLLQKEGLEDDSNLIDASAVLDRQWDDWKDENPRGSGNKRGDVGDRNF